MVIDENEIYINQLPWKVSWLNFKQKVNKKELNILIMGNNLYFSTNSSCALKQSLVKGPFTNDCSGAQEKCVEN